MMESIDHAAYDQILASFEQGLAATSSHPFAAQLGELSGLLTVPNIRSGGYTLPESKLSTDAILLIFADMSKGVFVDELTAEPTISQLATVAQSLGPETNSKKLSQRLRSQSGRYFSPVGEAHGWNSYRVFDLGDPDGELLRGRPAIFINRNSCENGINNLTNSTIAHELIHARETLINPLVPVDIEVAASELLIEERIAYKAEKMFTIIGHLALEDGSPYLPGILGLIEEEIHSEFGGGDESDIRIQVLIEELGLSFIFRDTDIGDLTKEQRKKIDTYVAKIHENAIATL